MLIPNRLLILAALLLGQPALADGINNPATGQFINGVPVGSATPTAGNLLIGSGTQWVSNAVTGCTLSSAGALTCPASGLTGATLASGVTASSLTSFGTSPTLITPTFTTSITGPLHIGGTGTTSTLTLEPTSSGSATTGADIIFKVGASAATEAMRILNSGSVGIGTASPVSLLTVSSNAAALPVQFAGTVAAFGGTDAATMRISINSFAGVADLDIRRANTTAANPSALATNDVIGQIAWQGFGATVYSGTRASVQAVAAEGWTDSAQGTRLVFNTTPTGSATIGERMRIDGAGNVGIGGATTPQSRLHVLADATYSTGSEAQIQTGGTTDSTFRLELGMDTATGFGFIQATKIGTAFKILALNPGGTAGVTVGGTTAITSGDILSVAGQITGNNKVFLTGLTAASGTPSSICAVTATKEITINAALTCTVSSLRYKHDFVPLDQPALPVLMSMTPGSFVYDDSGDRQRLGFASEYMAAIDRRLADGWDENDTPKSIDQNAILAIAVKSIQELAARVKELEARVPR